MASSTWPVVLGVAAMAVLGLFLFSLQSLLNPFVLFVVFVAALHPFRELKGYNLWVGLAALLTLYWLLSTMGSLVAPFVLSFVLAYILDPLVDRMVTRGLGRSTAILLLGLPVVGGITAILLLAIPAIVGQAGEFIQSVPVLLDRASGFADALAERLAVVDLPGVDEGALADRIRDIDPDAVVAMLQERQAQIRAAALDGIVGLGRGFGTVLTILSYVVLTPVLTFFLLRDYDGIVAKMKGLLPRDREKAISGFASDYDGLLSAYLRGQVTVALILGALTTVLLLIVQFPYAILLGGLVAVFSLVPYLGLVLSLVPAIVIALVSGNVWASLLKVLIVYGGTQALEGSVISPKIVGESVGLHPVWVVLALSMGGFFFGFVGLLIAVPLAVGVKLIVLRGLDEYRDSGLYQG